MTDITHVDAVPTETPAEVRMHRESFNTFLKFATFAAMHVALVLVSMAIAFFGNAPLLGIFLGVGGTIALVVGFLIAECEWRHGNASARRCVSPAGGLPMGSRRLFAVLLPFVLIACAEVQMATPQEDQLGKRFDPPPSDKGAVYLFRQGLLGAVVPVRVVVQAPGGALDVALAPDTWVRIEGEPGPLEIRCANDQNAGQRVDVRPGEVRYVEVAYRITFGGSDCGVVEASPLAGQRAVASGKRAVAGVTAR
jgi:hypothetical protein